MKKKIKFNFVDVILILFGLFVIAVLAFEIFGDSFELDFSAKSKVYVHAFVSKAGNNSETAINNGDTMYNTDTGEIIGTVESVIYTNSYETIVDDINGTKVKVEYPDLNDIKIVISTTITENNGLDFKVGQTVKMNVPSFAFTAEVTDITQYYEILEQSPVESHANTNKDTVFDPNNDFLTEVEE